MSDCLSRDVNLYLEYVDSLLSKYWTAFHAATQWPETTIIHNKDIREAISYLNINCCFNQIDMTIESQVLKLMKFNNSSLFS